MPYLPARLAHAEVLPSSRSHAPVERGRPVVLIAVLATIIVGAVGYGAWTHFLRKASEPPPTDPGAVVSLQGLDRARNPLMGLRAAVDVCYQNCSNYHMEPSESPLTYMQFVRDTGANDGLPKQLVDYQYDMALDAYAGSRFSPDPSFDYRVTVEGNVQAIPNEFSRRWRHADDAVWVELSPDYKWATHTTPPPPGQPIKDTTPITHQGHAPPPVSHGAAVVHKKSPPVSPRTKAIRKH